jgi:hypothetical protein
MNALRPLAIAAIAALSSSAFAKLPPAPPLTDAQKQEAAAKKAAADAKDKAELTRAQDRVAQMYIAQQKAKGVTVTPQMPSNGGAAEPQKPPSSRAEPEKAMAHSPPKKK